MDYIMFGWCMQVDNRVWLAGGHAGNLLSDSVLHNIRVSHEANSSTRGQAGETDCYLTLSGNYWIPLGNKSYYYYYDMIIYIML